MLRKKLKRLNKRLTRNYGAIKSIKEPRDLIDDMNPGLLLYIDLCNPQSLNQVLKSLIY